MSAEMTWEQAVLWLRSNKSREIVEACYFHDSPVEAAKAYSASDEFAEILRLLKSDLSGKKVLDIGAGNGISSFAFAMQGAFVTALEPDGSDIIGRGAITQLNKILTDTARIKILDGYGEKLDCPDASFDLIFARQVLHHAQNMSKFFAESFRLLKPGGMMLTIRDHIADTPDDKVLFLKNHLLHHLYGGENAYPQDIYIKTALDTGFEIVRLLEPLETVINYFPASHSRTKWIIRNELKRQGRLFEFVISRCLSASLTIKWYGRAASKSFKEPGRLFSMFLRKND